MDELINIKLEELFNYLDNSSLVKEIKILKNNIYNNQELLNKINHIQTLNKYDPKSAGSDAYMRLADEVINREED